MVFTLKNDFTLVYESHSHYIVKITKNQEELVNMTKNNSCERIQYVRNYYQLNQTDFSLEIGMSQSNYSKIELGKTKPSMTVLYALMARFAVNPNWVKTGQGEMLLSPDEYLANGVKLLGSQKIGEGLIRFLKDPAFGEVKSLVAVGELVKDNHGQDLEVE